jgi:hypothetical protein
MATWLSWGGLKEGGDEEMVPQTPPSSSSTPLTRYIQPAAAAKQSQSQQHGMDGHSHLLASNNYRHTLPLSLPHPPVIELRTQTLAVFMIKISYYVNGNLSMLSYYIEYE